MDSEIELQEELEEQEEEEPGKLAELEVELRQ